MESGSEDSEPSSVEDLIIDLGNERFMSSFGGRCLPKDLLGFTSIHDSNVLREIIKYNNSLRDDLK